MLYLTLCELVFNVLIILTLQVLKSLSVLFSMHFCKFSFVAVIRSSDSLIHGAVISIYKIWMNSCAVKNRFV